MALKHGYLVAEVLREQNCWRDLLQPVASHTDRGDMPGRRSLAACKFERQKKHLDSEELLGRAWGSRVGYSSLEPQGLGLPGN